MHFIAWFFNLRFTIWNVTLLLHYLTYMSILHLHKSCCLLVYPFGQSLLFGTAVQQRAELLVKISCWSNQVPQLRMWTFEETSFYKNLKTLPSARTHWAEPLHQRSPGQSVLSFRNAKLWKYSFPTGELAEFFIDSNVFEGTSIHISNELCVSSSVKQMIWFQKVKSFWATLKNNEISSTIDEL